MPIQDRAAAAAYARDKRLAAARCQGCDGRPPVTRFRASKNVNPITLCSVCLAALQYAAGRTEPALDIRIEFPAHSDADTYHYPDAWWGGYNGGYSTEKDGGISPGDESGN